MPPFLEYQWCLSELSSGNVLEVMDAFYDMSSITEKPGIWKGRKCLQFNLKGLTTLWMSP